jgi:hypothetical protein
LNVPQYLRLVIIEPQLFITPDNTLAE